MCGVDFRQQREKREERRDVGSLNESDTPTHGHPQTKTLISSELVVLIGHGMIDRNNFAVGVHMGKRDVGIGIT